MKNSRRAFFRSLFAVLWLVFTLSLTGWWFVFGLRQVDRLMSLQHESAAEFARYQRMLMWEGGALFLSLFGAGLALAYFMYRELRQRGAIDSFLATFTHELKTPIASLRLQAEALGEQIDGLAEKKLLDRLIADTGRLTLQLNNSLFLAGGKERELLIQELSLQEVLLSLGRQWPDIEISPADCILKADSRALEAVLQNLIHNAVTHGGATRIDVQVEHGADKRARISLHDNGRGFAGDRKKLGVLFKRHYPGSGSGIGVYLCGKLLAAMGGGLEIPPVKQGFLVRICLPES